jgi:hypothetical protein
MPRPLPVSKILLGAFLVPWWNRKAFVRALAAPLGLLVGWGLLWHSLVPSWPVSTHWLAAALYVPLFALFAVTCHRLVLLDPARIAQSMAPRWTRRETRFLFWLVLVWLIAAGVTLLGLTLVANVWIGMAHDKEASLQAWFHWVRFAVGIPGLYVAARLCLLFPATAIDRAPSVRWAWERTVRNGWRLAVIIGFLPWALSQMLGLLWRAEATALEWLLFLVAGSAVFVFEIAAVSLSYRELMKDHGEWGTEPGL